MRLTESASGYSTGRMRWFFRLVWTLDTRGNYSATIKYRLYVVFVHTTWKYHRLLLTPSPIITLCKRFHLKWREAVNFPRRSNSRFVLTKKISAPGKILPRKSRVAWTVSFKSIYNQIEATLIWYLFFLILVIESDTFPRKSLFLGPWNYFVWIIFMSCHHIKEILCSNLDAKERK